MKSCEEYQSLIDLYLDNELTREEKQSFLTHISSCNECREALSFAQSVKETLATLPPLEVPSDFNQKVRSKVEAEKKRKKGIGTYFIRYGSIAACLILAVAIARGIDQPDFSNNNDSSLPNHISQNNTLGAKMTEEPEVTDVEFAPTEDNTIVPQPKSDGAEVDMNPTIQNHYQTDDAAEKPTDTQEAKPPENEPNSPAQETKPPAQELEQAASSTSVSELTDDTAAVANEATTAEPTGEIPSTASIEPEEVPSTASIGSEEVPSTSSIEPEEVPDFYNFDNITPRIYNAVASTDEDSEEPNASGGSGSSDREFSAYSFAAIDVIITVPAELFEKSVEIASQYAQLQDGFYSTDIYSFNDMLSILQEYKLKFIPNSNESSETVGFVIKHS